MGYPSYFEDIQEVRTAAKDLSRQLPAWAAGTGDHRVVARTPQIVEDLMRLIDALVERCDRTLALATHPEFDLAAELEKSMHQVSSLKGDNQRLRSDLEKAQH
jgi:hypothetical protein